MLRRQRTITTDGDSLLAVDLTDPVQLARQEGDPQ